MAFCGSVVSIMFKLESDFFCTIFQLIKATVQCYLLDALKSEMHVLVEGNGQGASVVPAHQASFGFRVAQVREEVRSHLGESQRNDFFRLKRIRGFGLIWECVFLECGIP